MQRKDENLKKSKRKNNRKSPNLKEIGRTFECLKKYFENIFKHEIEKIKDQIQRTIKPKKETSTYYLYLKQSESTEKF